MFYSEATSILSDDSSSDDSDDDSDSEMEDTGTETDSDYEYDEKVQRMMKVTKRTAVNKQTKCGQKKKKTKKTQMTLLKEEAAEVIQQHARGMLSRNKM